MAKKKTKAEPKAEPAPVALRDRIKEIKRVRAGDLIPNPKNWRTHNSAQRSALKGILADVGIADAAIAYETKKGLMLIDGHLRVDTDPEQVWPVLVLDVTEDEADKLLATFDPISAMAGVDGSKLNDLLASLTFTDNGLKSLLDDLNEDAKRSIAKLRQKCDDDEFDGSKVKAIVKPGEVWTLGDHRIICGDCTDRQVIGKLFGDDRADLTFTSPPYARGKAIPNGKNSYLEMEDTPDDWPRLMAESFNVAAEHCDALIFNVQMLSGNKVKLIEWLNERRDRLADVIVWDKGHAAPATAATVVNSRFEFLFVFSTPGCLRKIPFASWHGTIDNVYTGSMQHGNEFASIHTATMPIHLADFALRQLCDDAKSVFDPFSGTGTTLIAAEQLGKRCFGSELTPAYCDVIIQRWQSATGGKAKRQRA